MSTASAIMMNIIFLYSSLLVLGRWVAIYEIGCVNANSAVQFEEGPRLGVFEKVKFI